MARPKRPSPEHTWCREERRWLSKAEVGNLTNAWLQKAERTGHKDIESFDRYGQPRDGVLGGKGARSVNIHTYLKDSDGALPADFLGFDYASSPTASRFQVLADEARFAIVSRQDWVTVGVLSMLASGYREREIERAMNIGRNRLRRSLQHLYGKYAVS